MEKSSEPVVLITDGAYSGQKNADAAAEKNIELVTTDLTGRETKDIAADFLFTEEGTRAISCPAGNAPKSCSYIKQTGQCRISFPRNLRYGLLSVRLISFGISASGKYFRKFSFGVI